MQLRGVAGYLCSSAFAFWSASNPRSGRGWSQTLSCSWSPTLRTASFSHIQNDWEEIQEYSSPQSLPRGRKKKKKKKVICCNSERRFTVHCIPDHFRSAPHHYIALIFVLARCVWWYELVCSAIRFHTLRASQTSQSKLCWNHVSRE